MADPLLKKGAYTAFGYRAAEVMRSIGRPPVGGSGDFHLRPDRLPLVRQAQAFDRDNGLYKGLLNRSVDNILGNGFALQSKAKRGRDKKLEAKWDEFGKDPEVRGLFHWRAVEAAVLRMIMNEGDYGAIKTNFDKLQIVESELIYLRAIANEKTGNAVIEGVEIDKRGRPLAFFVDSYTPQGNQRNNPKRIDAADFIFGANLERVSQTRGVPAMTSSFPMFHRLNDVCDSEAVAWQLLSKLALSVTKKAAATQAAQISEVDPAKASATAKDQDIRRQEFEDGTIFYGDEQGDEIKGIDRNIPGPDFTASVTMFLRLLGLPLGLPLELILLDWSKTNYSSARAALEQAFRMFTRWQDKIKDFSSAVYVWQVQRWIDRGEIALADDVFEHDWITPSFPWIDQLKEVEAWGQRIERGISTHAEALKSVNRDRSDYLESRQKEIEEAIVIAEALNAAHPGATVDWRLFAGLAPLGTTAAVHNQDPQADPASPEDNPAPAPTPAPKGNK